MEYWQICHSKKVSLFHKAYSDNEVNIITVFKLVVTCLAWNFRQHGESAIISKIKSIYSG